MFDLRYYQAVVLGYIVHYYRLLQQRIGWPASLYSLTPTVTLQWLYSSSSSSALINIKDTRQDQLPASPQATSIRQVGFSDHRGLTSSLQTVEVLHEEQTLAKFILKHLGITTLQDRISRIYCRSGCEVRLFHYFQTHPEDDYPHILKASFAHHSAITGEALLLLPDLRETTLGVNILCGNQCWGIPPHLSNHGMALPAILEHVMTAAARLHARQWNNPSLLTADKWSFLKARAWHHGKERAVWQRGFDRCKGMWTNTKATGLTGCWKDVNWSPKLVELLDQSFKNTTFDKVVAMLKDPSETFTHIHGDFHASNMLYHTGEELVLLLDWTETSVWHPLTDVGQFAISDLATDVRRRHEQAMLKHYWTTLCGLGIDNYSFEQCQRDYGRRSLERWLLMFAFLSGLPLPVTAMQYFHDQLVGFIEDYPPPADGVLLAASLNLL
eukprot:m.293078 g.293078  ORF g.293078 m.293078 type:complete len:441 (+) comp18365_c0_seq1:132-1454(+)